MEDGGRRRAPRRGRRQRQRRSEEAVALRRKVRELRRLVPDSAAVPADRLLLRTADYIVRLRARVELLRTVSQLISAHHGSTDQADGGGAATRPLAS
jgi:hypothetical protein